MPEPVIGKVGDQPVPASLADRAKKLLQDYGPTIVSQRPTVQEIPPGDRPGAVQDVNEFAAFVLNKLNVISHPTVGPETFEPEQSVIGSLLGLLAGSVSDGLTAPPKPVVRVFLDP